MDCRLPLPINCIVYLTVLLRLLSVFLSTQGPPHPQESLKSCSCSLAAPGLWLFLMSKRTGTSVRACWWFVEANVAEQVSQKYWGIPSGTRQLHLLCCILKSVSIRYFWIVALKLDEINLTHPKGHVTILPFSMYNTILSSSYLSCSHFICELVCQCWLWF